jgi:ribosome-dependent ATPase
MRDEPALELSHVSHRYGGNGPKGRLALDDVSLRLDRGAAVAVVGPDGVGKSTLLALVAGARRLQQGTIRVLGGDVAAAARRDAVATRIAYMPQGLGRNLYPTLSVAEHIAFFGRLYGVGGAELRARAERLLRATGLAPFPDRAAGKLSGGMRQKLSLCCALVHDPDLLVLDEPTTGVDPLSRRQFWALVDELRAERPGMTALVATAYMEEARRFEHLVAMSAGRVLAAGRTAEILAASGEADLEAAYLALQHPGRSWRAPRAPPPPRRPAAGPPAIRAEGLTRRFGDFTAVDHASFRIERGEIFGFIGPNGCGKTTTMKMLTGLLPASEGRAELLGQPVSAADIATRLRVGYVSQSFSLYEELSVRANLELHARLYSVAPGEIAPRVEDALVAFGLAGIAASRPSALPLGVRQRLQLAAACLHRPEILILDEPTSGVDPEAREMFWDLLAGLSRRDGVTIFISTHFMNEAERCDRISLMDAGKVLVVGTPAEIRAAQGAATLEDAFISYLEAAAGAPAASPPRLGSGDERGHGAPEPSPRSLAVSLARVGAFAWREATELLRDRVRLAFALLGPLVLMLALGYGISFDVEDLPFAVFDRDGTATSRAFVETFAGSRYFVERPPLSSPAEIDRRLRSGELRLAIEIPPGFGRDLLGAHRPEIGIFLDGAMPFRAETARGYVEGVIGSYLAELARREPVERAQPPAASIEPRYRYNQEFRSTVAIAPGCIMILTLLIPAMLAALGVVREREIGSISNLASSPASVGEFLLGKQMPYVAVGFASFLSLVALVVALFEVPLRGSFAALALGALLHLFAATAFGLFVSSFVRTQVAAIIVTAIMTTVPAINFSGFLYPVATVEGPGWLIGHAFPALWFLNVAAGTFGKALGPDAFVLDYLMLATLGATFLVAARLLLRKEAP